MQNYAGPHGLFGNKHKPSQRKIRGRVGDLPCWEPSDLRHPGLSSTAATARTLAGRTSVSGVVPSAISLRGLVGRQASRLVGM
jgi:hypothetical protein